MLRLLRPILFLSLILYACSPGVFAPETPPVTVAANSTSVSTVEVPHSPTLIATLSTPHIDQGPDGAATVSPTYPRNCGYQWAQKALPEVLNQFQQSIQQLQPNAQVSAFAFGEDCIYDDGSSIFIPMETDFNVIVQGGDLSDQALGAWIVQVMQIIDSIPPDQIVGPRPGRVGIMIEANGERKGIGFYIDQYHALPSRLSDAEIYQALQTQQ